MRGTLMPNACVSAGFSVAARKVAPSRVRSMRNHVPKHTISREHDDPDPIGGKEKEAEIETAEQEIGNFVGLTGNAVTLAKRSFDQERQAEREKEPVDVVELVDAPQEYEFKCQRPSAPTMTGAMSSAGQ